MKLWYLLGAQVFAGLASRVFDVVLVWQGLQVAEDYGAVGFLIFLRYLPYTLLGLFSGWFSDQFARLRIVLYADLFRALLLVAAALGFWLALDPLWILGAVAFLLTAARTFFQPALQGLLPELVAPNHLVRANALLHGCQEIIGIVAPIAGGFLLLWLPVPLISIILAVLFLLSAGAIAFIPSRQIANVPKVAFSAIVADYTQLGRLLLTAQRSIGVAISVNAVAVLGVAGVLSLVFPVFIKEVLQGGPDHLGWLMGMIAFGTVLGAVAAAHVPVKNIQLWMYVGWLLYGLLIVSYAILTTFEAALVMALILGFAGAIADILFVALIQQTMAQKNLSKTFAVFSTLANTGEAISAPLLAGIMAIFGVASGFAAGGGLAIVVACLGLIYCRKSAPGPVEGE